MMTSHEDIAIIGIGCRFPGASCLEEFWNVLNKGENHVMDIPPERWEADCFYDPDVHAVGKSYTKKAGLIQNYADFDNKLFGISESEAVQMDPQQRQVLESTYMALEDAGITRRQIAGQQVGVYIGAMNSDYTVRMTSNYDKVDHYSVAGLASSVLANRVSYVYDLTGPSMVLDTACSSSLVAVHQAGLALRAGDCSMAICGGVNLMLHPTVFLPLCKAQMLSPSGQCHAFSEHADGYTRGEGCGIVILKPLREAIKDADHIWGTIMTGVNQDGQESRPITAPSANQQKMLLKNVYTSYNIDPKTVEYIEAHGTGTKLGDPVEISALGEFFVEHGDNRRYLGSVKTNIGHLEPAAGIAGLIKVLLMMEEDTIVPSLHCDKPNKLVDFDRYRLVIPCTSVPWMSDIKVACVNSFGFGGTNCHAIVHSGKMKEHMSNVLDTHRIVSFSGCTRSNVIKSIASFLSSHHKCDLMALSFTSLLKREHFSFRKAFVASSLVDLQKQARTVLENETAENESHATTDKTNIVFVFCGMGTAWKGMCARLVCKYSIFASTIEMIDRSLCRFVSWSLSERLKSSYTVDDVLFEPLAIFACQVALFHLWESLGVRPHSVVGQSIGEVAAAHVAGILSLEDAVRVIYHRTCLLAEAKGGKMLLIRNIDVQLVKKLCAQVSNVNIALYYSPVSCTVSGDSASVDKIKSLLACMKREHEDCSVSELLVSRGYHSHHMNQSQIELEAVLAGLHTESPTIPMTSSVNIHMSQQEIGSPAYWGMNVRQPVRFADAIAQVSRENIQNVFIEIGPKPVLSAHMSDIFGSGGISALSLPSMEPRGSESILLKSICTLHELNISINWKGLFQTIHHPTPLPQYTFSHKTLLLLQPITEREVFVGMNTPSEHLFVHKSSSRSACTLSITPAAFPTVYGHKVRGIIVLPGAVYAETGFAIAKSMAFEDTRHLVVSVNFISPLTLKKDTSVSLDIDVDERDPKRTTFLIKHADVAHARGTVCKIQDVRNHERVDLEAIKQRCAEEISCETLYQTLERSGFTYGNSFATIEYALRGRGENLTKLKLNQNLEKEMARTVFHPAILDGMLQSAAASDHQQGEFLPVELNEICVKNPMERDMFVYSKMTHCTDSQTSFYLELLDVNGTVIAHVKKFTTKFIGLKSFDELSATFKPDLIRINPKESDRCPDNTIIVFTDADLTSLNMPWTIHNLDYLVEGTRSALDSVIGDVSHICFAFPVIDTPTMTGSTLQDELVKRMLSLRLIILYMAHEGFAKPMIVISEEKKVGSSTGVELAGMCLNEAIKGFVRCILREYRSLDIQLVHVQCEHFVCKLPEIISRSMSASLAVYPEVNFQNGDVYIHTIIPCPTQTPMFRKVNMDENDGVLCSRSRTEIRDPSFYPDTDMGQSKHSLEVELSSVSMNSPPFVAHDISNSDPEAMIYPIVCLEAVGKVKETEVVTCFPTAISKSVKIPKKCVIHRNKLPGYTAGLLTKLYTLWYMCKVTAASNFAILYSTSTSAFAKALECMLESLGAKSVICLCEDSLTCKAMHLHSTVISTVLITDDIAHRLMKCASVASLISLGTLIRKSSIDLFLWSSTPMTIHVVQSTDMYSRHAMQNNVPKMLKWIRSHQKIVFSIAAHLKSESVDSIPNIMPIHISEVLMTTKLDMESPDANIDLGSMNVACEHLFKRRGSYVVVGGLTGLGWECVKYLAERRAGSIAILNRRKASDENQQQIIQMSKQYRCEVISHQVDVTNVTELKTILFRIKSTSGKPIKGIFFGAAVLVDATLVDMTEEKLRASLAPKVTGVWNIHILTANLSLDYFVLHSSGAAVLGNAGQSNYGGGNAFLDGLARGRRQIGLCAQSINWGPLNLGMLATKGTVLRKLESQGYLMIDKKHISQCLTHILMLNEPQTLMCRIDKQKMAAYIRDHGEKTLMARLKTYLEPAMKLLDSNVNVAERQTTFNLAYLKGCSQKQGIMMLQEYIKFLVCEKALLDETQFEMDTVLRDQGLDSMYAMEVTSQILAETGVKMSTHEVQLQSVMTIAENIQLGILNERKIANQSESPKKRQLLKMSIMRSIFQSVSSLLLKAEYNKGHVIISTIQIPEVVNIQSLMEATKECVSRHPLTRTTYQLRQSEIITYVLPIDEAFDFRVISGSDVEVRKDTEEPILIGSQAPIRFLLLQKHLQLRIIFHRIAFDLKAITTFVQELESVVTTIHQGSELNKSSVSNTTDQDITEEILNVLSPTFQKHLKFWTTMVGRMTRNSFCRGPVSRQQNSDIYISRKLEPKQFAQIMDFTRKNGLTVFEYLASIYQLLLAILSNSKTATMTIYVDLRMYVPSLANSLGRCTNIIPLICDVLDDSTTLAEFMQRNKLDVKQFLNNGLFPSEGMKQLLPDGRSDNLERNFFIFEDDVITNVQNQLNVEMPVVFGPHNETFFYAWQRRNIQTMEIKLHLRKELFTEFRGAAIIDAYIGLVLDSLNRPTISLLELKKQKYMCMTDQDVEAHSKSPMSSLCALM